MKAHPTEATATEFLSKSLVAAGTLLAIPAVLSLVVVVRVLWGVPTWQAFPWFLFAWLAFCGVGFFLLWRAVYFVRSPESVRRPRLLWLGTSAYLGSILAASIACVVSVYWDAQNYRTTSAEAYHIGATELLIAALFLILPAWAFILSFALCIRPQRA